MLISLIEHLDILENLLWTYLGVPIVMFIGLYLSIKSNFFQIRHLPTVFKTFLGFLHVRNTDATPGVHPLKVFFAAVGGCVGIGNIVGVCTAVQLGGPGFILDLDDGYRRNDFQIFRSFSRTTLSSSNSEGGITAAHVFFDSSF